MRDYVLGQTDAAPFLDRYTAVLEVIGAGLRAREQAVPHRSRVGCTGGKHRSVVLAQQLADRLAALGVQAHVVNRDLGRE